MINIKHYDRKILLKNVDRSKSIVILAEGLTDYKLGEIELHTSLKNVKSLYGESEITEAFATAKDIGVDDIFLVNCKTTTDYIECIDSLRHYDFAFIVPIGIKFSDSFYNPKTKKQMSYGELYLEATNGATNSLIIMTDNHASLYEDIDQFLNDMKNKINKFKTSSYKSLRFGNNLSMVGNNLVDSRYANLILASVLSITPIGEYPTYDFGQSIFDLDDAEINNIEMIYFRNNHLRPTTVENLKNFRIEYDAAKLIEIDRVIKFINRELDFSSFTGKFFTDYTKLNIYKRLSKFLQDNVGKTIRGYKINSIDFISEVKGSGVLHNNFDIIPKNSIESFNIIMEV